MEKYVLVVEDDPNVQQMLVDLVEVANCKCVVADNGAIALELLETIAFNLITLDLKMPVMDGNQFLEKLPEYAPTTPVIIISGDLEKVKPHPQIKANLAKPFLFDQLLTLIVACLA
jgi:two-component system response regulator FlrC